MDRVNRRQFLNGAGAAAAAGIAGCIGSGGGGTQTVTIGLVSPFSGGYGYTGQRQKEGLQVVVETVNGSDEVLPNTELEMVVGDTKTDPEVGLSAARDLVLQQGVDHLMGATSSAVAKAIRNFIQSQDATYWITAATSAYLTNGEDCNRKTFRTHNHTGVSYEAGGKWSAENLGTDVYMLYQDYTFGYSVRDNVRKGIESAGGNVINEAAKPLGANTFGGVIQEIIDMDPDWVSMNMLGTGGLPFFQQAAQRGLDIPCSGAPSSSEMGKLTPEQLEKLPTIYSPYFDWLPTLDNEGTRQVKAEFDEVLDVAPVTDHLYGYVAGNFLAHALHEAGGGGASTDDVIEAGEGLTLTTPRSEQTIRECDHQAVSPTYVTEIVDVAGEGEATQEMVATLPPGPFQAPCSEIACRMGGG